MITRVFTESIEVAPRELEKEIWNMNATEQTDFLLALSQRYKNEFSSVVMQYEYLKDEVHSELTKEEQTNVVNMLKTLIEYLESEE